MPKVSIIVPVHNPGKYITPLLNSLISQTFTDIEILLIDDGSTDGTCEILKEYEEFDNRIKVVFRKTSENENFGEKYSVDLGRSMAQGQYIMIVDHDDELVLNAVELLYNQTKNGTIDVIQGRSVSITTDGRCVYETPDYWPELTTITDITQLSNDDLINHLIAAPVALWACLIRKDFQKDIELCDYVYNDTSFMWKLKILANSFVYIPQCIYIQHSHPESVSQQTDKYSNEIFYVFHDIKDFCKQIDYYAPMIDYLYSLLAFCVLMAQERGIKTEDKKKEFERSFAKEVQSNINIYESIKNHSVLLPRYKQLMEYDLTK